MSTRFNSFKNNCKQVFARISGTLQPRDINSTQNKLFSSVTRLPTLSFEAKMLEIFGKQKSDFPEFSQIRPLAEQFRSSSTSSFTNKVIIDKFTNYPSLVKQTLNIMTKILGMQGKLFEPISPVEAIHNLPKSTSSGFPEYITPKSEILNHTLHLALHCLNNKDNTWINYIVSPAWRTQMRKSGIKFRIIWVVPYLVQTFEMMFLKPIFDYYESNRTTAYCFSNIFPDISKRIQKKRNFNSILALDFSLFDASVPAELIILFFTWLKAFINIKSDTMNKLYQDVMFFNTYSNVAVVDSTGERIIAKNGSVLSGSVFTNFLDTFCNAFVCIFVLIKMGYDPLQFDFDFMGDDSLIGCPAEIDLIEFSRLAKLHFGMTINPDKCFKYTKDFDTVEFLGTKINETGRYIDTELAKKQMTLSTSWISEEQLPESERLFSKLCSICFKFTDGYKLFDEIAPKLLDILGISSIPSTFVQLFYTPANPSNIYQRYSLAEYKYTGWLKQ